MNSFRYNNYFSLSKDYNNYINDEIEKIESLNDSNIYDEILNNNKKYMNLKNIKRRNRKINSSQDDINILKIKMNIDLLSNKMSQINDAITKVDTYNINSKIRRNKRKNNSMKNIFEPQYIYNYDNDDNLYDYNNLYFNNNDNYNDDDDDIYNNYDYDMNSKYNNNYTPSSYLLLSSRQKNNIFEQNLLGNNYNNFDYISSPYNYNNNNYNITHDFFTINNNKNKKKIKNKKNKNLKNFKNIKSIKNNIKNISNENIKNNINNIKNIKSNINNNKNNNLDNFNICDDNMCFGSYDHYFLETLNNFDKKKNKKKNKKSKSKEKERNDDIIKNNSLSSLENENDYYDPDDNIHINYMKKKEISKKIIDRNIKKEEKEEPPPESPLLNKLINIDNKIKNKNDSLIDLNDLQIKMEAVAKENEGNNYNIMSEDKKLNEEENEIENNFIKTNKKKRKISFHEDENITIEYDKRDEITKISIFNFFGEKQNFKPRNINVILEKLKRRKINPILLTSNSRNNFKKVIKNKKSFSRSNSKSKEKMKKSSSTKLLNSNKLNNGRPLYDKMHKEKVNKRHKICEKFKNNPQKFYSTDLNDLMIKNLVYESESDKENKNNVKNGSGKKENRNRRKIKEKDENANLNDMEPCNNLQKIIEESDEDI